MNLHHLEGPMYSNSSGFLAFLGRTSDLDSILMRNVVRYWNN